MLAARSSSRLIPAATAWPGLARVGLRACGQAGEPGIGRPRLLHDWAGPVLAVLRPVAFAGLGLGLAGSALSQAPVPIPGARTGGPTVVTVTAEDPAYVIANIAVEKTGADAVQARSAAIVEGQRRALRQLVQRVAPQADPTRLPPLDDRRLQQMVRGVEFANERSGADRYAATLTVAFAPDQVKAWLQEAGIVVGDLTGLTVLVIPVWRNSQGVAALEDRHVWREAWERNVVQSQAGTMRSIVLRADDTDRRLASAEQVFVGDVVALAKLAQRYRTTVAVVSILQGDPTGPMSVEGLRYDSATGARSALLRLDGLDAGKLEEAARRQLVSLEEEWKAVSSVRRDSQGMLDAAVPIRDQAQWVRLRQRLQGLPAVKKLVVRALETERAEIRIEHFGSTDELQRALNAVGLELQREGSGWLLLAR